LLWLYGTIYIFGNFAVFTEPYNDCLKKISYFDGCIEKPYKREFQYPSLINIPVYDPNDNGLIVSAVFVD